MTEGPVEVTLKLPHLIPGSDPPPNQRATARMQHIFNDIDTANHKPPIFHETGAFADDTLGHVKAFQQEHHINPSGIVGPETWQALLERWAALPTHPVEPPPPPPVVE